MGLDLLMCITPHYDRSVPINAPFLINSVAKQNGFNSKVIDFNYMLFKRFKDVFEGEVDDWRNVDTLFDTDDNRLTDFPKFNSMLDEWTDIIIKENPKYVAFSALVYLNYICILELSKRIKKANNKIKIIVGGVGSKWMVEYDDSDAVDHFVIGYGEGCLPDILRGNIPDHIIFNNTLNHSTNYIADYSDVDMKNYTANIIYIPASRGCIYNCSFCLVKEIWDKFNLRPIDHVVEEMTALQNEYEGIKFKFSDSIMNGILSHTRKLCKALTEHNFKWSGMISIRNNMMIENDYKLLHESGCTDLSIGIESGSQKVRKDMGKSFSNDDIFETLEYLTKYNIESRLFFITGYPTETDEDFLLTKKLVKDIKERGYLVKSIRTVYLSIKNNNKMKGIEDNPNFIKRFERYEELREYLIELGFDLRTDVRLKKWCDLSLNHN